MVFLPDGKAKFIIDAIEEFMDLFTILKAQALAARALKADAGYSPLQPDYKTYVPTEYGKCKCKQ